jgi:putative FmdB family regulatory protein
MPIYEYQCKSCCHCFEKLVLSIVEPPPKCPQCAFKDVIKLMSAATIRSQGIPTGSGGFKEPACKPSG